jgi:hypothetical protein
MKCRFCGEQMNSVVVNGERLWNSFHLCPDLQEAMHEEQLDGSVRRDAGDS